MKLQDLFEEQKVINGYIELPAETTKLDYKGVIVKGHFNCTGTKITSLEGAPSWVGRDFGCSDTKITSLKGAPSYVGGWFSCTKTFITSLEGAPKHVGGGVYCNDTKITSLHNVHKHIKHIGNRLVLSKTIQSSVISVMLIKGIREIDFHHGDGKQGLVTDIINEHLQGARDIHACQEELLEAGLGEFAKL